MHNAKKPVNQANLSDFDTMAIRRRVAAKSDESVRKAAIKNRDRSQMSKEGFHKKYNEA